MVRTVTQGRDESPTGAVRAGSVVSRVMFTLGPGERLSRPHRFAVVLGLVAALTAAAAGCGGAEASSRAVSPYQGHPADLFDDTIEPAAVGLDFDKGYAP